MGRLVLCSYLFHQQKHFKFSCRPEKNILWLSDTFRKTNISVERFHCKKGKKKEKPLIKEQKQNKSNACLVWGPGTTLFSSLHKLNRFNCLFICQSQPVQGDSGESLGGRVWRWSCYCSQHLQCSQLCTISTAHIH